MLSSLKNNCLNAIVLFGLILFVLAVGFGIPFLFTYYFIFDSLLNAGLVKSQGDFVNKFLWFSLFLMVPPLLAWWYRSMSPYEQEDAISVISGVTKLLSWVGYGALFMLGMKLAGYL